MSTDTAGGFSLFMRQVASLKHNKSKDIKVFDEEKSNLSILTVQLKIFASIMICGLLGNADITFES